MLNKSKNELEQKPLSLKKISEQISVAMPKMVRHMHPFLFKDIDVPPAQMYALLAIEEEGACNLKHVGKCLYVSCPTACGLIDRLVKNGYVRRTRNKQDRRGVKLNLTKSGREMSRRFRGNVKRKWYSLLEPFPPEERMGPLNFFNKALKQFEEQKVMSKAIQIFVGCVLGLFMLVPSVCARNSNIIELTLDEASALALENNFDVQLAQFDIQISRQEEPVATSIYDALLKADIAYERDRSKSASTLVGDKKLLNNYDFSVKQKLPSGTDVTVSLFNNRTWTNSGAYSINPFHDSSFSWAVKQPLGRNFFGIQDRGQIKLTRMDIEKSTFTSMDRIESDLAHVQQAYWDLVFQFKRSAIESEMVDAAKKLADLHQEQLKDGLVEKPDALASEANYKKRLNEMLIIQNDVQTKTNVLRYALNLEADVVIQPEDKFVVNGTQNELVDSLKKAYENRYDFQKAQTDVQAQELNVVLKKTGLLPEINLEASLSRNGVADHFKQAYQQITEENHEDFYVGLNVSFPLGNNAAEAKSDRAKLEKAKALVALKMMERKIAVEVADQVRLCNVLREAAHNTDEIAALQNQKLAEEQKRFKYGRSDTDTIIRFQEDALNSRLAAAQAKFNYYVALTELRKKEGVLLEKFWKDSL